MKSLASLGKLMAFGCTVVSTGTRLRSWLRNALAVRHPKALGQQLLQLVAEPLVPMAQIRALVRENPLEKLFAGEELEVRIVDPALAHTLIGQPVNVLEQQQPDHETGLDPGPAVLAVQRRDLVVDPVPIDLAASRTSSCFMLMIWSSRARNRSFYPVVLCFFGRIVPSMRHRSTVHGEGKSSNEFARFGALKPQIPAILNALKSQQQTPAQSPRGLSRATLSACLELIPEAVRRPERPG